MTRPSVRVVLARHPREDDDLATALWRLQRAAYAVEAELIGDDRIPALHEGVGDLASAPLHWVLAEDDGRLLGALAWRESTEQLEVDRLVVEPAAHRRGVGRALVEAVVERADGRDVVVSTGRDNAPARRLYERAGFCERGDREVVPGLWVTDYRLTGGSRPAPGADDREGR
ncbi:GNAT family N-acetyltransferase [Blastococcus sp. TF02-8]|uniref:GNAT family N-acetyltransferase n=1 Tax=Blastococcus sp. TF02-8 TaxID=2250574 RepID=UPI000DEB0C04|nr:GNAT family N-acetyltransferase [Blastococcus sp. TF02-8]RBY97312.1 GNAT family N-acetyltransferase [Blastococcus sp. TF02-8]